jgi:hypothetical protein
MQLDKSPLLKRKVHELTALYEISQALNLSLDIERSLYGVMAILEKYISVTPMEPLGLCGGIVDKDKWDHFVNEHFAGRMKLS